MREKFDESKLPELDARLDGLFAAYRDACPDPEPSADFNSRLWARIEGRPQLQAVFAWQRWARAFLSLAAVASLFIGLLQLLPQQAPVLSSTYLDQLSEDEGPERMLLQDVAYTQTQPALPAHGGEKANDQ